MKDLEIAQRFLKFVNDFYRFAAWDQPVFEFDARASIAFEACVEDVSFSVGYDPLSAPMCLFVYCVFGVVPLATEAAALRRLLALNVSMAKQHNATYCIDDSTQELAFYMRTTMDVDASALHAKLTQIAQLAHRWRRDCLTWEHQDTEPMPKAGQPPSWTDFA
jgi:hypothetical protein